MGQCRHSAESLARHKSSVQGLSGTPAVWPILTRPRPLERSVCVVPPRALSGVPCGRPRRWVGVALLISHEAQHVLQSVGTSDDRKGRGLGADGTDLRHLVVLGAGGLGSRCWLHWLLLGSVPLAGRGHPVPLSSRGLPSVCLNPQPLSEGARQVGRPAPAPSRHRKGPKRPHLQVQRLTL